MRVNISIPDDLYTLLCSYCNENGFKVSTLLQHLIKAEINYENSKELKKIEKLINIDPSPDTLEGQIGNTEKVVMKNVAFNKVGEIIKKVQKTESCPHGIMEGGYCRKCKNE